MVLAYHCRPSCGFEESPSPWELHGPHSDEDEQSGQPDQFAGPTGGELPGFRRESKHVSVQQDRCGANVSALRPSGSFDIADILCNGRHVFERSPIKRPKTSLNFLPLSWYFCFIPFAWRRKKEREGAVDEEEVEKEEGGRSVLERHDRLLFQEYLCTKAMHSCNSQIPLMPGAPASAKMAAPFLARYSQKLTCARKKGKTTKSTAITEPELPPATINLRKRQCFECSADRGPKRLTSVHHVRIVLDGNVRAIAAGVYLLGFEGPPTVVGKGISMVDLHCLRCICIMCKMREFVNYVSFLGILDMGVRMSNVIAETRSFSEVQKRKYVNMVAEPKPHQTGRKRQNVTKTGNDCNHEATCIAGLLEQV
ncbi:hypothetical protein WN51_02428 [Melipona quadrifasciata]|uniref:Uncharacterized protein n=1 Tax=Melipona quadrifasciata TaxID=166423 RepID=A0A0M8ZV28_9HYME|nr:hypothetical protein WN51_02428 [Melipona quadrifasciata]